MTSKIAEHDKPYIVAAVIALFGMGTGSWIYVTASSPPANDPWEVTSDAKIYARELERFGGKTNVMMVQFQDWFASLWHGKTLGLTVAVIALLIALVYLVVATSRPAAKTDGASSRSSD